MQFILLVVLKRTVRSLTTVDVVLEEYNNCHVKDALLMISSTSNNIVCSSSK